MITKTAIKLQPWARALTLSTHRSKELPEINVSQSSMLQKQVTQYANLVSIEPFKNNTLKYGQQKGLGITLRVDEDWWVVFKGTLIDGDQ